MENHRSRRRRQSGPGARARNSEVRGLAEKMTVGRSRMIKSWRQHLGRCRDRSHGPSRMDHVAEIDNSAVDRFAAQETIGVYACQRYSRE